MHRLLDAFNRLHARRRVWAALQLTFVVVLLGSLGFAFHAAFQDAWPRLKDANLTFLAISMVLLAVYYLTFVVGWCWILAAYGIRVPYRVALGAEMSSMLAKYVPGGVWTPMARVAAMHRAGYKGTAVYLAAMALEAGLSAIAGIIVFVVSLHWVGAIDFPLWPLVLFAVLVALLLQPRVFERLASRLLRGGGVKAPPWSLMAGLLVYYALTWLVGGAALLFLLKAVGADPSLSAVAFLGGVGAVGAIVAVVSVLAPSGLGVREASMYGLMLAVAPSGAALGATVLNRLTLTVVEALLLLAGVFLWRMHPVPAEEQVEADVEAEAGEGLSVSAA
jgi:uncharacterized membrane protein YbhN (UPF0104 family)